MSEKSYIIKHFEKLNYLNYKEEDEFLLFNVVKDKVIEHLFYFEKMCKGKIKDKLKRQRKLCANFTYNDFIKDDKTKSCEIKETIEIFKVLMFNETIKLVKEEVAVVLNEINLVSIFLLASNVKALLISEKRLTKELIAITKEKGIKIIKTNKRYIEGEIVKLRVDNNDVNVLFSLSNEIGDNLLKEQGVFKLFDFTKSEITSYLFDEKELEFKLFGQFQHFYFKQINYLINKKTTPTNILIPAVKDIKEYEHVLEYIKYLKEENKVTKKIKLGIVIDSKSQYERLLDFKKVDFIKIDTFNLAKEVLEIEEQEMLEYKEEVEELVKEICFFANKYKIPYLINNNNHKKDYLNLLLFYNYAINNENKTV